MADEELREKIAKLCFLRGVDESFWDRASVDTKHGWRRFAGEILTLIKQAHYVKLADDPEKLDRIAVGWLVDCTMADARDEKVSRFSDFLNEKHPKDLTIKELLALNPATKLISEELEVEQ